MEHECMKRAVGLVVVVSVVLMVAGLIVFAEPVTVGSAENVADAFIGYEQAKSKVYRAAIGIPEDVCIYTQRALMDGRSFNTLAYVFELKPSGYIVVTADTQIVPIVAYSFTGTFSWEESPENVLLDMLRQDMANRLCAVHDGQISAEVAANNEERWEEYRGIRAPDRVTYEASVYGPWTLDPWNQDSPYWNDCPMDPNKPPVGTHRCLVGCVATALAQILNYWQYPTSVTFLASDNYTSSQDPGDGNGTRTISIIASTANFSGLNYNNCSPSDAAKADLSFAAGVSVRMDYSSEASGALIADVASALAGSWSPDLSPPQRWGYHSADVRAYNSDFSSWGSPYYVTQTTFFNDLRNNMMQARPAQMAISKSTGGGHSIVVDGYHPTDDDYHLNYGWGASCYGWYSLPSGFPSGCNILDYAVYNIVPTTSTYTMSTSTSGTGTGTVQALPGTGALTRGTHVLVSATPTSDSLFIRWTGALSSSDNPAVLILDGNKSVNAVFSSVVVSFPDPGLEAAIRDAIGKPTGDIYESNLVGLTSLNAYDRSIANLEGIQHCVDLTHLWLSRNEIVDISALSGLTKLTELWLDSNQIVDISTLSGLTNLTKLVPAWNQIVDISALSSLANLWVLELDKNEIVDISALSGLTNLTKLDLDHNQIVDISALSGLANLAELELHWNQIVDISALSGLTKLTELWLGGNQIVDISTLSGLTNLTTLHLGGNQVIDISVLSGLTSLDYLAMFDNEIIDISPLSGLTNLTKLELHYNQIVDISALSGLTNLTTLHLYTNQIADISPVSGLTNLTFLWLEYNQIVDISPVSGLTNLTRLDLQKNQIVDISPVSGLTNLTWLSLDDNQISSIAPLVSNAGIGSGDNVDLRYNQLLLASGSPDMLDIETLQGRGVNVTYSPQNSPADTAAVFRVEDGFVFADQAFYGAAFISGSADIAEWVIVSEPVEPGDVLELDPSSPGQYRKARGPCSTLVGGVVSTNPGVILGSPLPTGDSRLVTEDSALLALLGIVPVKVTDEGGPIQPGDLLVTSSTPGYAMRWDPGDGSPCYLVGKALEPLTEESGIILILLTAH